MRSALGELTDSTNRAQGFALIPAAWGFGATIGFVARLFYVMMQVFDRRTSRSMIGGSLSHPHERFSKAFPGSFWKDYPYFLPCLVSSTYVLFASLTTIIVLKEVRVPIYNVSMLYFTI